MSNENDILLIMRSTFLFIIAVLLTGCATAPDPSATPSKPKLVAADPIGQLVARLTSDSMWQNGRFPIIDLPETAPPEQVIKRIFELTGFNNGHVKNFEILEIRHVDIGGAPYSAALVQTDLGEKIVLFTAGGGMRWSRVCDP